MMEEQNLKGKKVSLKVYDGKTNDVNVSITTHPLENSRFSYLA